MHRVFYILSAGKGKNFLALLFFAWTFRFSGVSIAGRQDSKNAPERSNPLNNAHITALKCRLCNTAIAISLCGMRLRPWLCKNMGAGL